MASEYSFKLTRRAARDLDEILSYIAVKLSNPTAAGDFADDLQKAIDEACTFPESGSAVINEFLPVDYVRKKIVSKYVMYYIPDAEKKEIQILRIVYGRRNLSEIIEKMNS